MLDPAMPSPCSTAMPHRRIFLTGLTASGKSTIAPLLGAHLGWTWVDLDRVIEHREGMTIAAIFARDEQAFRELESAVLAELAQATVPGDGGIVIATGGGAIIAPANRAVMHANGLLVALRIPPDIAAARLATAGALNRPLLRGNARQRLRELADERAPLYAGADFQVDADADPAIVAHRVLAGLLARGVIPAHEVPHQMIAVPLPITPHTITVTWGGLTRLARILDDLALPRRVTIITDDHVGPLYLEGVQAELTAAGYAAGTITIPAGEEQKTLVTVAAVYDELVARRAERGEAIVALGGGVVGDLAGFVAATYLRGVPLIQVPTTLLAQVDSAIGGKTGVNHPRAKNMIGAFYQPRAILIDPATLLTLSERLLREGLGEVVKYGVILDANLFADLEAHHGAILGRDPHWLVAIIARSVAIKVEVIVADEREAGRRLLLNYGHTIGHALETLVGYGALLHGEAIFLGMAAEARIAQALGLIGADLVARQDALIAACGGPPSLPTGLDAGALLEATRLDKKTQAGRVRWVLPDALGHGGIYDVPDEVALATLQEWLTTSSFTPPS